MANRKKLTYSEHEVLAARVKAARDLLNEIYLQVSKALGTSAKASKLVGRARANFDDFKTELSIVADRDCPELDTMTSHFGAAANNKVVHLLPKDKLLAADALFDYITSFAAQHNAQPSYAQISEHFGVESKTAIVRCIVELEERGLLKGPDSVFREATKSPDGGDESA